MQSPVYSIVSRLWKLQQAYQMLRVSLLCGPKKVMTRPWVESGVPSLWSSSKESLPSYLAANKQICWTFPARRVFTSFEKVSITYSSVPSLAQWNNFRRGYESNSLSIQTQLIFDEYMWLCCIKAQLNLKRQKKEKGSTERVRDSFTLLLTLLSPGCPST